MSSSESSILAAEDGQADDGFASLITDLSIGSLFTKSLLILLFVFFLIRLSITIFHHCRRRLPVNYEQHRGYLGDDVLDSTARDPGGEHDEESPVENDEDAARMAVQVEAAISSYPSFMYGDDKKANDLNNTTCPICMSEYLESETMRMMPQCGHYFHLKCLDEWLRIKWSCPVCRDSPSLPQPQATPAPLSSLSSSSSCD